MELKPQYLLHLAAIGRHGSYVSAAESLKISQPALSISIQRIEDITKAKLVERGRNGAKLTPAGMLLARRGHEIDMAVSSAIDEIDLIAHGISGRLRIGGTPLSTNGIIPKVINEILQQTTDVSITVTEGIDEDLLELLANNVLDVVISAPGSAVNRAPFTTWPLFTSRTVAIVRPDHRLAKKTILTLSDLEHSVWAIPPKGGAFRVQIEALFTAHGIPFPQRVVEAASIHTLMQIVCNSDAVTIASEQIIWDTVESGAVRSIKLKDPVAVRLFGLHVHQSRELGNLGQLFCDVAKKIAPTYATRFS